MAVNYSIKRIFKKKANGVTSPRYCTMNAILKADSNESPQCVYNEQVATNLAQVLHIPNAMGVLTHTSKEHSFASLEIAKPGIPLPNIRKKWFKEAAGSYPNEVAALVAFDIFIGNTDRYQNLKVTLQTKTNPIFMAFDHSHSLLHPFHESKDAIKQLRSMDLIAKRHSFYGLVKCSLLHHWVQRLQDLPDYLIIESCEMGSPINSVDTRTQSSLAGALVWRKNNLHTIIDNNLNIIRCVP